jgi:hypothetical protein
MRAQPGHILMQKENFFHFAKIERGFAHHVLLSLEIRLQRTVCSFARDAKLTALSTARGGQWQHVGSEMGLVQRPSKNTIGCLMSQMHGTYCA